MRLDELLAGSVPERGDRGPVVTALQQYLSGEGFDLAIDGIFGAQTARVARLWQFLHFGRDGVGECDIAVSLVRYEEATSTADDVHDVAELASRLPVDLIERDDLTDVWQSLHHMRAEHRRLGIYDFDELTAWVAVYLLTQGIDEVTQNRGPWVDLIVFLGGGEPTDAAPWCARFVVCCRYLASWLVTLDGETARAYPKTGSAARTWLSTPAADRLLREEASWLESSIGGAFVRTRTSAPESHRETVLSGGVMKGHTGIVVDLEGDGFVAVAGNSSGSGHSKSSGSVAIELISPTGGHALRAWRRLVGIACTWEKI